MFEAGLYNLLATNPTLAGILGSGSPPTRADGTTGIFPVKLPESPLLPAVVFGGVTGANVGSHDGTNRLESKRLQIDCYAKTYLAAKNLAATVRDLVTSTRGALSDDSTLDSAFLATNFDSFEDAPFSYRVILEFDLWFSNAVDS